MAAIATTRTGAGTGRALRWFLRACGAFRSLCEVVAAGGLPEKPAKEVIIVTQEKPPQNGGSSRLQWWLMVSAVTVMIALAAGWASSVERKLERVGDRLELLSERYVPRTEIRTLIAETTPYVAERQLLLDAVKRNAAAVKEVTDQMGELRERLSRIDASLSILVERSK